ncbi:monooxygenase [Corallococcus praedator]|uniref:Monooxygenase n=1 Tax=Corallococcus praedator TaxID=2316724 RepID=A0ABX9QN75_9BACT|nr:MULTISPECIES: FAD-dependent monooxygenase [Corallococcus]RKH18829.1 monooxygenase [Corallococcus sp. CA047B]RKH33945.1 monooxygenase [Corallococcus sp. CA031C]RKI14307.1 monooxygenase [Corallococcus praedator]
MRVAIIGAGLNGLACAVMLKRLGVDCVVFERGKGPRDSGTGIYVWPQAMQVLRFVLKDRKFLSRGQPIEFLDTHDKHGRLIHSQPVRPDGLGLPAPAMMFLRTELFRLLADSLEEDDIHYDMGCEKLENLGDQVRLTFTNGHRFDFDLVVGADGVSSTTRGFVNPGLQPHDTGLVASRGVVTFDSPLLHSDRCQIFTSHHSRVVTYPLSKASSLRYWFAAYQHKNQPLLDRQGLLELFAPLPEDLLRMMARTPEEDILTHKLKALTGEGQWFRGRVVMLGDSIHAMLPTLGYGLTLGLENGFMLAQALVGHCDADLETALKRYEIRAARRSREMLQVMNDFTQLYYFEPEGEVSPARLSPIVQRFQHLAQTTVF